jgi:dTDP-4-amino-4,6-dideoxygalactose transaminase
MPRVLASDRWVLGPEVAAFEAAWASYLGAAHALLVLAGQPWRPRTD